MDREQRLQLLNAYADGELSPEEREVVEKMLREDPDAAYESTQIVNIKKLINTWEGTPGSGRLRDKVLAEVGGGDDAGTGGAGRGAMVVMTVAATVLIIAGAVFLYIWYTTRGANEPEPETPPAGNAPAQPAGRSELPQQNPAVAQKSDDAVLRVTEVDGLASIEADGRVLPLAAGSWLSPQQTLLVDEAARVELTDEQGLRLRLAQRGRLALVSPREVRLESGRVLLHLPAEYGPFAVVSGKRRMEAGQQGLQNGNDVFAMVEQLADGRARVALRRGLAKLVPLRDDEEQTAEVVHGGNEILLASDGSKLRQQFYQPGAEFDGFSSLVGAP